jgi:hypothetical protein
MHCSQILTIYALLGNFAATFILIMGKFRPAPIRQPPANVVVKSRLTSFSLNDHLIDLSTAHTPSVAPPSPVAVNSSLPGKADENQYRPGPSSTGTTAPSPSSSTPSSVHTSLPGKADEIQPPTHSFSSGLESVDDLELARSEYKSYLKTFVNLTRRNADTLDIYLAELRLKKAAAILDWINELRSRPPHQPEPPAGDPGSPTYSEFSDIPTTMEF